MTKKEMIDYLTVCRKDLFGTAADRRRLEKMKKYEVAELYVSEADRGEFEDLMINTHTNPEDWA